MRHRLVCLGSCVLLGWLCAPVGAADSKGLRVEYRVSGGQPGPGQEDKRTTTVQRITVDASGLRLRMEETPEGGATGRTVILRADRTEPVIYELLEGKQYRERSGDLNDFQKERRLAEENEKLNILQHPKKEREAYIKERPYLKLDGPPEVKVAREPAESFLGKGCEHVLVTENGRSIVDGLVTKDVGGARSYFELYRKLGAFSDEVLGKLRGIDGVLLKGRITVVTALKVEDLDVEATKIESVDVSPTVFEVDGLLKVDDVPKEAVCVQCGKKVDPKFPGGGKVYRNGKLEYLCSEACLKKLKAEERKK